MIKKTTDILRTWYLKLSLAMAGLTPSLVIADALQLLEKPTNIVNEVVDGLSGPIAIAILTLVIVIIGFLTIRGRFPTQMGIFVCIGAFVIGGAGIIADMLIN